MFVSLLVLVSLVTNYVWVATQANKVEGEQSGKSGQVVLSFAYALARNGHLASFQSPFF